MSRWIYLSHWLSVETPAYGGGETFGSIPIRSLEQGDSCNAARWIFPNHIGTHIDLPRHFVVRGRILRDYPADFWVFRRVYLMDVCRVEPGRVLDLEEMRVNSIPPDTDFLLVKTGFEAVRHEPIYWQANPVFRPELAEGLRKRCANLRVMGFDAISLSSWSDRALGRKAHKAFLDHPRPILPLEDMALSRVDQETSFIQVIVSPLGVGQADAAPCLVLAEVKA